MKVQNIKIEVIKPYEKNTKKHPETQIKNIAESIKQFGFIQPVVLDNNNEIVIGHGRYLASQLLGYEEIPCVFVDNLSEEQIRKLRILDNKLNESEWDDDLLRLELEDLDFGDFDVDFGLDFEEEEKEIIEDEAPEVDEEAEPICKLGDIWQLGRHRLICGDSTDKATVELLMNGNKADMVFTDPPYGMKKESEGVLNDNLNFDDLLDFNKKWIPLTFEALKDNGSWYCWGIDEPLMDIYSNILKPMQKQKQIAFRNLITWDKGNGQGQLSEEYRMYAIADEKCLFVMVGGDSVQGFCVNQEDYSESMDKVRVYLETEIAKLNQSDKTIANALGYKDGRTVNHWRSKSQFALPTKENYEALREYGKAVLKDYDFLKKDYDELKKDFYEGRSYFDNTHDNMNNVWHFDRAGKDEREHTGGHATPKPIALCSRAIKSSSREGETVLDVFGGSGSTLIACEQLNRKCYMVELSEAYCDVIIKRWENLTGKKAVKIN
jgi:DNA modification methylase